MLDTYRAFIGADPDEFDSARDDDGHGTHTASTAAGNAEVAAACTAFPRGRSRDCARGPSHRLQGPRQPRWLQLRPRRAIDQAVADGVDVINYSVGGGLAGPGADEIAFLFAADAGVIVATSHGNSGPEPATLGIPASVPWLTTVGASTQTGSSRDRPCSSDGWEFFGASITPGPIELPLVDAGSPASDLCIPGHLDAASCRQDRAVQRGAIARAPRG